MKFKVGDRIVFYWSERLIGVVKNVDDKGILTVQYSGSPCFYHVHPKQCRKLVKKKRREFWIEEWPADIDSSNTFRRVMTFEPEDYIGQRPYIHVREVLEKS